MTGDLAGKAAALPRSPGVYLFKDGAGTIHGDFIPEKVASACTRVSIEKRRREEG